MKAEQTNAYNQVIEALSAVNASRTYKNTGTAERAELDAVAIVLEELSWDIVKDDISGVLEGWKLNLSKLKDLNKNILDSYKHLRSVSDRISKAAEVIGVLVDVSRAIP